MHWSPCGGFPKLHVNKTPPDNPHIIALHNRELQQCANGAPTKSGQQRNGWMVCRGPAKVARDQPLGMGKPLSPNSPCTAVLLCSRQAGEGVGGRVGGLSGWGEGRQLARRATPEGVAADNSRSSSGGQPASLPAAAWREVPCATHPPTAAHRSRDAHAAWQAHPGRAIVGARGGALWQVCGALRQLVKRLCNHQQLSHVLVPAERGRPGHKSAAVL